MAQGFRAAEAFVEVTADLDDGIVLAGARRVADAIDRELNESASRTGETMTQTLARSGDKGGEGLVRGIDGRLRDSRGRFVRGGEQIGEGLVRGIDGRLRDSRGRFAKSAGDVGESVGSTFGDLFGKGMSRALRIGGNPYVMAALLPAVVGAAPFLGAALAAGIVSGTTLAAIGGGIALAVRDPEIKHAAAQTGKNITDSLEGAAEPFKGELLEAFALGERSMSRWEPWIRRIGAASAQGLMPLARGITGLIDRALPGMTRAIERIYPAFVAIERGLRGVGQDVGDLFDSLSDNGAEMAAGMTGVFMIIRGSIQFVALTVNGLTEAFGWMMDRIYQIGALMQEWGRATASIPGPIGEIGKGLLQVGNHIMSGKPQWDAWRAAGVGAALGTADAMGKTDERTRLLNQSMGATLREAGSLSAAFQLLNGAALSAREAESAYQAAIDGVTASIKANGKTLDLNTEKGRANDAAIRQLISSVDRKAQAVYDETLATKGAAAAETAATKVYEQGRAQLVKNLTQILGNATAANKLADEIMGIPKSWSTTVNANTAGASAKINSFHKSVTQKDGTVINYVVRVTRTGDHYIPGQGTQLKADGGPIVGGSGVRDDVPVLAMGGEYMIKKSARRALERTFGPGVMDALNGADKAVPALAGRSAAPSASATPGGAGGGDVYQFAPGSITLDASKIKDIADLIAMIKGLPGAAGSMIRQTTSVGSGAWA